MPAGPSRRPQRYAGTDRQVRGLLLAVLRDATGPVPRSTLDTVWADDVQRARALASILEDGLACEVDGHYALGTAPV
jgi:A/G-specific adenine glycosylase